MSGVEWLSNGIAQVPTEFAFTRWGWAAARGRYFVCVYGGGEGGFFLPQDAVVDDFGSLVVVPS